MSNLQNLNIIKLLIEHTPERIVLNENPMSLKDLEELYDTQSESLFVGSTGGFYVKDSKLVTSEVKLLTEDSKEKLYLTKDLMSIYKKSPEYLGASFEGFCENLKKVLS